MNFYVAIVFMELTDENAFTISHCNLLFYKIRILTFFISAEKKSKQPKIRSRVFSKTYFSLYIKRTTHKNSSITK